VVGAPVGHAREHVAGPVHARGAGGDLLLSGVPAADDHLRSGVVGGLVSGRFEAKWKVKWAGAELRW